MNRIAAVVNGLTLVAPVDLRAGGLCGVAVDPTTGTVWINVSDRGFYRSDDQAKSFRRCGDVQPKGRTETPGCFLIDPTGASRKMLTALVYGSPVSVSADDGTTW